jgi:uncharacterized protein (DUF924 family)
VTQPESTDESRQVREFWFGTLPLSPADLAERTILWFGAPNESPDLREERDDVIRARFGTLIERAALGELASWADSPRRRLSLIILMDQFPRNIYRGTSRAFAYDAHALELTITGIQSGADAALDAFERMFFYMPMQHAESLDVQEQSVSAFRTLANEAPQDHKAWFEECAKYAVAHRDIIQRFGRFPHRNRILGRVSTMEERAFLASGADTFGQ